MRVLARLFAIIFGLWVPPMAQAQDATPFARLPHAGTPVRATLTDLASIEPFLDGYVAAAMADQYPPGMMVAVATQGGVFVKAYGVADMAAGAPATTDTLFRIASISKTFVWVAVTMLADERKISLDADVNDYLKEKIIRPKFGKPVTLNDLMAHRPGFEDTLGDIFGAGEGLAIEEALAKTRPGRVAPPGERTAYSNWGTDLAAQIVADVSGVPFDEFVRTRILSPLGMVSTIQHDPASIARTPLNDPALDARLAAPHKLDGGAPVAIAHDALEPLHAAGAVALDAHDAARWLQFLISKGVARDGVRLISPEAFTLMRLRAFGDRNGAPDFAHGFMETEIAGARSFGHGGTLTGFIADMTISPALGLGVFVVVNGAERPRLPDLVSRAIIEQFAGASSFASPWRSEADEAMKKSAQSVAGTYLNNRRVLTRFEKILSLGEDIRVTAKEDGSLVVAAGDKETRYYPLAEDIWTDRSRDRLFVYRNADGSVKRLSLAMGTTSAEPASFLFNSDGFNAALGLIALFSIAALVGAWRRQGREVQTTPTGLLLSLGHGVAALLWLGFIGVIAFAGVTLGDKDLPDFQAGGWPPPALLAVQIAAHVAALAGLLSIVGVAPVLMRSGWSLWRKAHYLLFAAASIFIVAELWLWRAILAPHSG